MIVLSVGMPKAGTAWYFNLENDVLVAAGYQDARVIRKTYGLHSILKYNTCNIQEPTPEKLELLTSHPICNNTFVVKTHHRPTEYLLQLIARGAIKPTYIYRDPRDVAISGFEEGQKLLNNGRKHRGVNKLRNIEDAILWSESWLIRSWKEWKNVKEALVVRYEDLLTDTLNELKRLCFFLRIELQIDVLINIIDRWKPERIRCSGKGDLHFNKGTTGRFREIMSQKELNLCKKKFGEYLPEMGYSE
jgi:hypothetical protein